MIKNNNNNWVLKKSGQTICSSLKLSLGLWHTHTNSLCLKWCESVCMCVFVRVSVCVYELLSLWMWEFPNQESALITLSICCKRFFPLYYFCQHRKRFLKCLMLDCKQLVVESLPIYTYSTLSVFSQWNICKMRKTTRAFLFQI